MSEETQRAFPPHLRPHAAQLNFDSTISRRLVHRNFIDHVLVTDVIRVQDDQFLCGARIPQAHNYFNEAYGCGSSSILLAAETMRQSCIALSHKFLDVSPGFSYILQRAFCSVEKVVSRRVTPEAGELLLDIHLTDRSYRRSGELVGLVAESTTYCAGEPIVRARGEWMFVPPKMYERLRRPNGNGNGNGHGNNGVHRPIAPNLVGRKGLENIVISALEEPEPDVLEAFVIVDPEHPYFFEHRLDHVSGMLLLEACNQVGIAAAARLCGLAPDQVIFKCFDAGFEGFAALDQAIKIDARVQRDPSAPFDCCALMLDACISQNGEALGGCKIGMASRASMEHVDEPDEHRLIGSEIR